MKKRCDKASYNKIFHLYIEVHSLCNFSKLCVHSREVLTLGKFKQQWDLADHARSRLSSMFALKLQYKVESLTGSKHSKAMCDLTYACCIVSGQLSQLIPGQGLEMDWWTWKAIGWMTLGKSQIKLLKGWADPTPGRTIIKETEKHLQHDAIGLWPSASLSQNS